MENWHHILKKNGEIIYTGTDNQKVIRELIPRWHQDHKGDIYDLTIIREEDDNVVISYHAKVARSYIDGDLNMGEQSSVTIPKDELVSLLKLIGI